MYRNIEALDFEKELKENECVLLDVRTSDEYSSGHIPNSQNIDIMGGGFQNAVAGFDKDKKYMIYCRSGARSGNACAVMHDMGFKDLTNLWGGIMSWRGEVK